VAPFFPPGAWLDGHASRSCPGSAGADGPAVPGSSRRGRCRRAAQPPPAKVAHLAHLEVTPGIYHVRRPVVPVTGAVRVLPFTPLYVLLALCNTVIAYFLLMLWQGGRVCAESDITSTVRCGVDWSPVAAHSHHARLDAGPMSRAVRVAPTYHLTNRKWCTEGRVYAARDGHAPRLGAWSLRGHLERHVRYSWGRRCRTIMVRPRTGSPEVVALYHPEPNMAPVVHVPRHQARHPRRLSCPRSCHP
jgi:hypothetical protein